MAIIYTYGYDDNVQDGDAWIGTNASNRKTKQFTVASVANYLNRAGRISIGGQMTFKFVTLTPATGTISLPTLGGDGTNFTDIASLYVSAIDTSGANVTEWLDYLVGQELLISEQQEPNNFGHYRITSYTVDTNPSFYTLVLTDIGGYGTIKADTYYNLNNINLVTGTTDPTGLEAINEGNGIGWRLIGRDADNYGPIGLNAIDFSNSNSISTERGSTGENSITFGNNNINQQTGSIVLGANQSVKITDTFQGANIITGFDNFIWGATYGSLIAAYRSTIGVEGTNYTTNALYQSLIVGDGHNYYAGRDSGVIGGGLISGSTGCFTVGIANEDLTTTTSNWITAQYNNYGPRFIVGVGTYTPTTGVAGIRQNGFVVMSDGTATFPVLSNAMIDAAGDDSAVTKGWVNSGPALTSEQVRIEVKNTSGVTLVKGTPVYITGTVGATIRAEIAAADASSSATMPAVGVLAQDLINNADGYAVTGGFLSNVTTDPIDGITPVANQTVYVKPGGGLTLTKPTGSNLIQNIAKVGKISGGNAGSLVISSILRTNDVPNLTTGKIWVGTATNTTESGVVYLDEGNGYMGIGTTTPATKLDVVGNSEFNGEVRISSNNVHVNDKLLNIVDGGTGKEGIHIRTGQPTIDFQDWNTGGKGEITSDNGNISIQSDVTNTKASSNITFLVDASERMRITDAGNVGIGTTSPSSLLTLNSAGTLATGLILDNAGSKGYLFGDGSALSLRAGGSYGITINTGSAALQAFNGPGNFLISLQAPTTSPIYSFFQDSDTGIGRPSADRLAFYAGGERMRITDIGNVGIGTTSPTHKLELGSGDFSLPLGNVIRFGSQLGITKANIGKLSLYGGTGATTAGGIDLYRWNGAAYSTALRLSNTGQIQLDEYGSGTFTGTATQRLAVDSSGNVIEIPIGSGPVDGSGTANYTARWIDVDTIGIGSLYDDGTGVGIGTTTVYSNSLNLNNAGSLRIGNAEFISKDVNDMSIFQNKIRVTSTGNVGIGTTSPAAKLEVVGVTTVRKSGVATPHADTDLLVTDATAAASTAQIEILGGNAGASTLKFADTDSYTVGSIDYSHVANSMSFRTNNSIQATIASSGNVGIGITSPRAKLEIKGTGGNASGLILSNTNEIFRQYWTGDAVGSTFAMTYDGTGGNDFQIQSDGDIIFADNTGGNVGIGTTTPAYKLDVQGSVNTNTHYQSLSTVFGRDNRSNNFISYSADTITTNRELTIGNATYSKILFPNGNVGIGTTNPSEKLHVSGSLLVEAGTSIPYIKGNALRVSDSVNGAFGTLRLGSVNDIVGDVGTYSFKNGTTTLMRISNTGNVGIGTTNPTHRLYVQGNNGTLLVAREITTPNQARIGIGENNPSTAITFGSYSDRTITGAAGLRFVNGSRISELNTTRLAFQAGAGYFFYPTGTNPSADVYGVDIRHLRDSAVNTTDAVLEVNNSANSSLMLVRSNGSVGIGTTSPAATLDVVGSVKVGNNATIFSDGSITLDIDNDNNQTDRALRVTQHGATNELFRIQEDGNVGVGTATPAAKLDVNGGVRVADDAATASATNVGTLRYRTSGNNSYVDMCMQTGAATYAWVNIVQNNW